MSTWHSREPIASNDEVAQFTDAFLVDKLDTIALDIQGVATNYSVPRKLVLQASERFATAVAESDVELFIMDSMLSWKGIDREVLNLVVYWMYRDRLPDQQDLRPLENGAVDHKAAHFFADDSGMPWSLFNLWLLADFTGDKSPLRKRVVEDFLLDYNPVEQTQDLMMDFARVPGFFHDSAEFSKLQQQSPDFSWEEDLVIDETVSEGSEGSTEETKAQD